MSYLVRAVADYPQHPVQPGHVEPVPRRLRGFFAGAKIFDTTRALYVWEIPTYPAFLIPRADVELCWPGRRRNPSVVHAGWKPRRS